MRNKSVPRKRHGGQSRGRDSGHRAAEPDRAPPVALDLRFGRKHYKLTVADLKDRERVASLAEEIRAYNARVKFELCDPLGWSDEARTTVTTLLAPAAGARAEFCVDGDDEKKSSDLFRLMMSVEVRIEDVANVGRYMQALVEAAAACHSNDLDVACSQAATRLRELGLHGFRTDELVRQAKALCTARDSGADSKSHAAAFLEVYRDEIGLSEQEAVCYLRGDFLIWEGRRWRKLADQDGAAGGSSCGRCAAPSDSWSRTTSPNAACVPLRPRSTGGIRIRSPSSSTSAAPSRKA